MLFNLEDTICAQSTPSGRGGIHVIRVSGSKSIGILKLIFTGFRSLKNIESHKVYYGFIYDPKLEKNIDEVLVTYFQKGQSFTSEETIEISCHGNPLIVKSILSLLIQFGCRMADKGEFTYRAFKGGRLNLAQAEAVLSLIDSNHTSGVSKALELLNGDGVRSFKSIENDLIWCISQLEARIDFSTEDIEFESNSNISDKLLNISNKLNASLASFKNQSIFNKGIKTLILGPPNAGKSSLFNYLLGSDRSIVSAVAGTTRDYLSEFVSVNGLSFEIIDTAGIRLTHEDIERQGILKINELINISDLVLFVLSSEDINFDFLNLVNDSWKNKKVVLLINKVDLCPDRSIDSIVLKDDLFIDIPKIPISVVEDFGMDKLMNAITDLFINVDSSETLEIVSLRQSTAMESALAEVLEGINVLQSGLGDEYILSHLNRALKSILSISFIENDEIVRDRIFKDFCLGK
jgi:tRNA modification GTPase